MAGLNYQGLFCGWELAIAKSRIAKFRRQWTCLAREDFEDLLQEVFIDWLEKKKKCKSADIPMQTRFMMKVVENKLFDMVKERERQKRMLLYHSESLDQLLYDDEDTTLLDTLHANEVSALAACHRAEMKDRIEVVNQKLTQQQRKICEIFSETENISEIARRLELNRKTVYKEIMRIRKLYEMAGLKIYANSRDSF